MTTIKQQLEKEDLGRELLGKVAIILQTSGQASAAAEKLKQAAKLLNGDSLQEIASKLRREREREPAQVRVCSNRMGHHPLRGSSSRKAWNYACTCAKHAGDPRSQCRPGRQPQDPRQGPWQASVLLLLSPALRDASQRAPAGAR